MKKTDINGITLAITAKYSGTEYEINDGKIVNCIGGKVGI